MSRVYAIKCTRRHMQDRERDIKDGCGRRRTAPQLSARWHWRRHPETSDEKMK